MHKHRVCHAQMLCMLCSHIVPRGIIPHVAAHQHTVLRHWSHVFLRLEACCQFLAKLVRMMLGYELRYVYTLSVVIVVSAIG